MKRALVTLGALLLASQAGAATWKSGTCSGPSTTTVSSGGYACARPISETDDTAVIQVKDCDNIDFGLVEDRNGNGSGATALTATIQWCPVDNGDSTVDTDAERDAACVNYTDGSSAVTLTGDGTIQGIGSPSGYIRVNMGGTFAQDPEIWLHCNGPLE